MIELDFSLLPEVGRPRLFRGLPQDVEERIKQIRLPETLDRVKGASWLFSEVSAYQDDWLNRAYLRAGLSEFRSVDQALYWDLGRRNVFTPLDSKNPLVHLILRLRRIAVYVANADTSHHETSVEFHYLGKDHDTPVRLLVVKNVEKYLRNESLSDYREKDIQEIVRWFEKMQMRFGASDVLNHGVILYCVEMYRMYAHRSETAS